MKKVSAEVVFDDNTTASAQQNKADSSRGSSRRLENKCAKLVLTQTPS